MTSAAYPHLFSPLTIRGHTIRNRIFSTGHDTKMPENFAVSDALVAYHMARARGGAGLIITQVAGVHRTAMYTTYMLMATSDACMPGYRRLADALHAEGTCVYGQLFHPGREIMESQDGALPVAYAPSAVPNERFHVMPRPMSKTMIREIVQGYAAGARRMTEAGLDGVEIVGSHGYLPSQFLNPRVNLRQDRYGGSARNRLRFLEEVLDAVRAAVGPDKAVGMRLSGDEADSEGLTEAESLEAIAALESRLDYINVIAGTSASLGGAVHIAPPMAIANAYVAPFAAQVKAKVKIPVFVAGRINQPQTAEQVLAGSQADMCGMTRALIADPEMPNKAQDGRPDDIRACIACNQACIGHFHLGHVISCIQHPETGRELLYPERQGKREQAAKRRRVMVVGGGPGGMKAAAVAAERGHDVTLYEAGARLGGQALLAQLLPGRAEFGGIVTNLEGELARAGVKVVKNTRVDRALVEREHPEALILATGGKPRWPTVEGAESGHLVDSWQVLRGEANVGSSVVVADWRCDWVGMGIAEKLARDGCSVRLAVAGLVPGQVIPQYVRDNWAGTLHKLGVEVIPYARLYGVDGGTAYFQHIASGEPLIFEGVDTIVLSQGQESVDSLSDELAGLGIETHLVGDCLAPRSAEEAVLEGLRAATAI